LTCFSQLDPANFTNTLGVGVNSASYSIIGEAHILFKRNNIYYFWYSGLTGLSYNQNNYQTSTTPIGPWSGVVNPYSANTTPPASASYNSQCDQVIKIPGRDDGTGKGAYLFVADDFEPALGTRAFMTKLMMPIAWSSNTASLTWLSGSWFTGDKVYTNETDPSGTPWSPWNVDSTFPNVSQAPLPASGLVVSLGGVATWTNNELGPYNIYLDTADDAGFTTNVVSEVLTPGTSSFSVLVPGNYYRIRTVNWAGTSLSSAVQQSAFTTPSLYGSGASTGIMTTDSMSAQYRIG
jgi:hypothetical protein